MIFHKESWEAVHGNEQGCFEKFSTLLMILLEGSFTVSILNHCQGLYCCVGLPKVGNILFPSGASMFAACRVCVKGGYCFALGHSAESLGTSNQSMRQIGDDHVSHTHFEDLNMHEDIISN